MALKAIFPPGKESITVTGLYQWDYGQQLEIEDESLPEHIDVHFSCTSMTEAIVRDCCRNEETGIHTVFIPDDCLEQASPITAWIYDWSVTSGKTVKVINLPVIARARPSLTRGVSSDEDDHFATLVTELNAAVNGLKNGTIKVKSAETADNVPGFTGEVESATFATQAMQDGQGAVIHQTYEKKGTNKTRYYTVDGNPAIYKNAEIAIGGFPNDKRVDNIAVIGLSVGLILQNDVLGIMPKNQWLRLSGVKMLASTNNPMSGANESSFYTTAIVPTTSDKGTGISSMNVVACVKNNTLYLRFEDGFYAGSLYKTDNTLAGGMESIPDNNPHSAYGFFLSGVCVCFA